MGVSEHDGGHRDWPEERAEALLCSSRGGFDLHRAAPRTQRQWLVTIHGAGLALSNSEGFAALAWYAREFARMIGARVAVARSNFRDLDYARLHTETGITHWWPKVQHELALIGLALPVALLTKSNRVAIPASDTRHARFPWGSEPDIDERVRVRGITVVHLDMKPHGTTRSDSSFRRLWVRRQDLGYARGGSGQPNRRGRTPGIVRSAFVPWLVWCWREPIPQSLASTLISLRPYSGSGTHSERLRCRWETMRDSSWSDIKARADALAASEFTDPHRRALARWLQTLELSNYEHKWRRRQLQLERLRSWARRIPGVYARRVLFRKAGVISGANQWRALGR